MAGAEPPGGPIPPGSKPGDRREAGRRTAAAAGLCLAAALVLSLAGVSPFRTWSYQAAWYPLLVLLDGTHAWRTGRFALLGRPRFAASLFLWSVPFWLVFEALNLRLANWFYVNVPEAAAVRWAGYGLAFATVLPAVYLPDRLLRGWLRDGDLAGPAVAVGPAARRTVAAAGVLFLLLPLWRPTWFFPLVWGAAALLLEPWNHVRDPESSLLGDVERGRYGRIVRLLLAGLAAGLLWESMNVAAGARWIYTVPGLETGKLFEMPYPGFVGFTVFGLECRVAYQALANAGVAVDGWNGSERTSGEAAGGRKRRAATVRTVAAGLLAGAFCAAAAAGIDRRTAASERPEVEDLPGLGPEAAAALRAAGIDGVAAVAEADSGRIAGVLGVEVGAAGRAVRTARLSLLRGLGARNASRLVRAGVEDVCALADAPERRVAGLLEAGAAVGRAAHRRRVRVWLRGAREACRRPDR